MIDRTEAYEICEQVAIRAGLMVSDLLSKGRTGNKSVARQHAMYLLRTRLDWSYPQIATFLGLDGHAAVIHAVNKVGRELDQAAWVSEMAQNN